MTDVRMVEAKQWPVTSQDKPTGIKETYVENDWHCPRMVKGEVVEHPSNGLIFQGMPTEPCAIFGKDGTIYPTSEDNEWGHTCRFYHGEFDYGCIDVREETGRKIVHLVKCSNPYSVDINQIDLYLHRIAEEFKEDEVAKHRANISR